MRGRLWVTQRPQGTSAVSPDLVKMAAVRRHQTAAVGRVFVLLLALCAYAARADAATIHWEHPQPHLVAGFIVSVDGVRTDHGRKVLGPTGECGCSLTLRLRPGKHRIVVIAYNRAGETPSAVMDVTVADSPPPTLPKPWLTQDIGAVDAEGSVSVTADRYTVVGSGSDIWGNADSFRFLFQPLNGDGSVVARVDSLEDTHTNAKAGVMIRDSLNPKSAHATLNVTPRGVIEFLVRNASDAQTILAGGARQQAPVWLRLSRSGNAVTAALSRDGTNWTTVGTTALPLSATARLGLVVASLMPGTLNTSTFGGVSITPGAAQ